MNPPAASAAGSGLPATASSGLPINPPSHNRRRRGRMHSSSAYSLQTQTPYHAGRQTLTYTAPRSLSAGVPENALIAPPRSCDMNESCVICYEPFDDGPCKSLRACGHTFHFDCIQQAFKSKPQCPVCRLPIGQPRGKSPSGQMTVSTSPVRCSGFREGSIVISYSIPRARQMNYHDNPGRLHGPKMEMAYLPNNADGTNLLKRLKYAFLHGLTFAVGTSMTTGAGDQCTWASVHHKTSPSCGAHGFPDDEYFDNCNGELDGLGVPPAENLDSDGDNDASSGSSSDDGEELPKKEGNEVAKRKSPDSLFAPSGVNLHVRGSSVMNPPADAAAGTPVSLLAPSGMNLHVPGSNVINPPAAAVAGSGLPATTSSGLPLNPLTYKRRRGGPMHSSSEHLLHSQTSSYAARQTLTYTAPLSLNGRLRGKSPSGQMAISTSSVRCSGFKKGSIVIRYSIPCARQMSYHNNPGRHHGPKMDTAYLPNNVDGINLLKRLKYAFLHGLTFTVGTSMTSGARDQCTWASVHHKTSPSGGVHGFPDDKYFDHCNAELDGLGVPPAEHLDSDGDSDGGSDGGSDGDSDCEELPKKGNEASMMKTASAPIYVG